MPENHRRIIPAYTRREYPTIRAASKDWMPETFEEWLKPFSERRRLEYERFRETGIDERLPHIRINPNLFRAWLAANDLESTEETRARFAMVRSEEVRQEQERRGRSRREKDAWKGPLQAPNDPRMPEWANRLQVYLTAWLQRHGL